MKAIQIHQYGGAEELKWEDAPMPEIQADEVLVKVYATGVNPVDWKVREGYLAKSIERSFPIILGWDVAGEVEKTGDAVTNFKQGDQVYAKPPLDRQGTYAEFVAVKAAELSLKPKSVDFVTAAAIPLVGLTAWQGLFDQGQLKAGQKVLIQGAAGGVGTFAVQFAKWKGAFVIGTASKENKQFLEGLGADQVIDYHEENFEDRIKGVDVLFDTIGGETQKKLLNCMKPGGIVVSTVGISDAATVQARGLQGKSYMAQAISSQLQQIANLVDEGKIKVIISKIYPLAEAAAAHKYGEEGHTQGKIVLKVAG